MNTLYYGDNLEILKNSIKDETIDLIYLDPPFQSGKDYNIINRSINEIYNYIFAIILYIWVYC